jgi:hypothetical protein
MLQLQRSQTLCRYLNIEENRYSIIEKIIQKKITCDPLQADNTAISAIFTQIFQLKGNTVIHKIRNMSFLLFRDFE